MLSTVGLAIALFASTNIDDIFVLLGFFADPKYRPRQVIIGQYIGIAVLVAVSVVASLISLVLAPAYVGLLGLVPILIGFKKLYDLQKGEEDNEMDVSTAGLGNILAVTAVTVANGGDNVGIYTPIFATRTVTDITTIIVVFTAMVAAWLGFSYWLVNHRSFGVPIRRFGHIIVPFVLIAIGVFVLYEAGSFSLPGAWKKKAAEIATNAPLAVEATKEVLNRNRYRTVADGIGLAQHKNMVLMHSEDLKRPFSPSSKDAGLTTNANNSCLIRKMRLQALPER